MSREEKPSKMKTVRKESNTTVEGKSPTPQRKKTEIWIWNWRRSVDDREDHLWAGKRDSDSRSFSEMENKRCQRESPHSKEAMEKRAVVD